MPSAPDRTIEDVLNVRIAVVGLLKDSSKPSRDVAAYMRSKAYRIIPVNHTVVDVFGHAEDVPPIVDHAIRLQRKYGRLRVLWMRRLHRRLEMPG